MSAGSPRLVVGVPRAVVTINGVDTHIDGVLGPLLDFVLGFFIDDLVDNIEDAFASQIKPVLQPLVRDALRALAFTTSFDVPKVQGGGNIGVDVITDFQHNLDTIDLSSIDAKTGVGGNNAFKWIGGQGFHGVKGELHFVKVNLAGTANDKTIIEGDTNGDGKADFQIQLTGLKGLSAGDFDL